MVLEKNFGGRPYLIRDLVPGDAPEVLRLFVACFGHQPDRDWFEWKYGAGNAVAVGLWDENGRLMAHCAGIPRAIAWHGEPIAGVQIGDVMVSPELRGLVMRKGPFQQICSHFFGSRVGADRAYPFAWGFPNQRHLRLGTMLDLYWDAGIISQLSWPAKHARLPLWWSFTALSENAEDFDSQVGMAWQSMARDLKDHVVGVRDANYVRWRFLARPDRQYRLFALRRRFTGGMLALVVMRVAEDSAELLDVIGPRSVFRHAVRAAINEAAGAGADCLTAWASHELAELARGTGAAVAPSGASLAIIKESDLSGEEVAAARWWWMGGDTDFR
jgi:hypothetical protein